MYILKEFEHKRHSKKVSFKTLFQKEYIKRVLTGIAISIFQQLSGVNFFILYSTNIFNQISGNGDIVNLVIGFSNFCSSFIGMFTLSYFGRKTNLVYG